MKIYKSTIKKRGQFPYDQFISYRKGREVKFKACLFEDLKGAFYRQDEFGRLERVYFDDGLESWIKENQEEIELLEEQREFLLGVKELIGK